MAVNQDVGRRKMGMTLEVIGVDLEQLLICCDRFIVPTQKAIAVGKIVQALIEWNGAETKRLLEVKDRLFKPFQIEERDSLHEAGPGGIWIEGYGPLCQGEGLVVLPLPHIDVTQVGMGIPIIVVIQSEGLLNQLFRMIQGIPG